MKKGRVWWVVLVVSLLCCSLLCACGGKGGDAPSKTLAYGDPDLKNETSSGLESMAQYKTRFTNSGVHIGDVMPYYHDGIYSFFYLAETSNHPVYRVDTTDFVHFVDKGEALAAGASNAQDSMIGTGSIAQAGNDYYFFYTGFKKDTPEAVMLAKSEGNIDNFAKVPDFMLAAAQHSDLDGWDFRDPEAMYDAENEQFVLFISARKGGAPVIAKYTVSLDLTRISYDGVVYTDTRFGANVLECSDVFRIGDKWYLTYSVQDVSNGGNDGALSVEAGAGSQGKMFYAMADSLDGPFERIADASLDSHAYYAAKTVQDGANTYLAGWIRQKNSNLGWQYLWGGNLQVHQLTQNPDGSLNVALPQSVRHYYSVERALDPALEEYNAYDMIAESKTYHTVSEEYSSYLLHTTVNFDSEAEEAGFALGVSSNTANIMEVTLVPAANKVRSGMSGQQESASKYVRLIPGRDYDLRLLVEGSAVTLYIDDSVAFTSRIRNLGNKKLAVFAKDGSVSFRDFHLYTPSGYADTLSSDGNLTVTEAGVQKRGAVRKVTAEAGKPAIVTYAVTEENYLRYTAAVYGEQSLRAVVKLDGTVLEEVTVAANKLTQIGGTTYAAKGKRLSIELATDTASEIWVNASVETDKKPFDAAVRFATESDGTATFTAGESGVYEYVASMYYAGDFSSDPVFEVGDGAMATVSEDARLVTVHGGVYLAAGEKLHAALAYKKFPAAVGAHRVTMQVRGGGSGDTFVSGIGTYTVPVAKPAILVKEIVPTYAGIEFTGIREMSAEMNGNVFGEQGENGFVYAYGKAGDELKPMTEYNTNGEIWEYKHKAPEANDALEIKADFMKQGGGYVTAVAWVAPAAGFVDYSASYTRNGGYVQVQVWHNRTLLHDAVLHDDFPSVNIAVVGVQVKEGDSLVLAVRAAGNGLGESDGNYGIRIGKGNSTAPYDPDAPLIADFAADYNTERQGDYGWKYLNVTYEWGANEHPSDSEPLSASEFGWGNNGKGIAKDGTLYGDATAAWCNTTDTALTVSISGNVYGNGSYIRMWVMRADGGREKVCDGKVAGTYALPNKGYVLQPGDMVAVLFFDNGAGSTLDMKVRSSDAVYATDAAIAALLAAAKEIRNEDGRYTQASFAALAAAIETADAFVAEMQNENKTYIEVTRQTAALKAAINGLKLDTTAARAELEAQLSAAGKYEGKTLLGDGETFAEALKGAQDAAAKEDATSDELTAAANALESAMENISIRVADFAADFAGTQGGTGWMYFKIGPVNWDDYGRGLTRSELTYDESDDTYKLENAAVSKTLWRGGGTVVAYVNYTDQRHTYYLRGSITYSGGDSACVAYVIARADGTYEHLSNWNVYRADTPHEIRKDIALDAGDAVWLVLRDVDGKPTDSVLDVSIGCDDTLTVGKSVLEAAIASAESKNQSEYTPESWQVFADALLSARAVKEKADASIGEIYGAAMALKAAQNALALQNAVTSTTSKNVTDDSGLWQVYHANISNWDGGAHFASSDMALFTHNDDGSWTSADGSVTASEERLRFGSGNGKAIAFVFTVQAAGRYTLVGNYTDGTRQDGRCFVESAGETAFYEKGWIGKDEHFELEMELKAGDRIAIQFEPGAADALLDFSLQKQ